MTAHSYKPRNHFNTERTFGVEIETIGMDTRLFVQLCANAGISANLMGYTHVVTHGSWKIVTDGSLTGGVGYEIVSPPLKGEAGLNEVETVLRCAREAGATVNRSTGFHVHHAAGEYTPEQAAGVLLWYAKYEPVIDALVAPSRRQGNQYCVSLRKATNLVDGIQWLLDAARSQRTTEAFSVWFSRTAPGANGYGVSGRYHKVNLASWQRYGTIEFRHHQGTLNGSKARAWIVFTQRILERGGRGRIRVTNPSRMDFAEVVRMLGMQDSQNNGDPIIAQAREYLKARLDHFAAREARNSR